MGYKLKKWSECTTYIPVDVRAGTLLNPRPCFWRKLTFIFSLSFLLSINLSLSSFVNFSYLYLPVLSILSILIIRCFLGLINPYMVMQHTLGDPKHYLVLALSLSSFFNFSYFYIPVLFLLFIKHYFLGLTNQYLVMQTS